MDKRERLLCLYFSVALSASLALAATIAYLEVRRSSQLLSLEIGYLAEIRQLRAEFDALKAEVSNRTVHLSERVAGIEEDGAGKRRDDDDYYYDPDDYEDESDGGQPSAGGGGGGGGRKERKRREISPGLAPYNLILRQGLKTHNSSRPMEVKAKIIIDTDQDEGQAGYEIEGETLGRPEIGGTGGAAVHLTGDSTRIRHSPSRHRCYDVNHRMCHIEGIFRDWDLKKWGDGSFTLKDGHLTLNKPPGIYFLYAQIFYADNHDSNGYRIYVNGEPVFQCTTTNLHDNRWIPSRVPYKKNSCYTGGLVNLKEGDRIAIRELDNVERFSVFEPYKSYFGLFQVISFPSSRS